MKTSQKNGGALQTSFFHRRWFELNISTGLLKVYEEALQKPTIFKYSVDLRGRIV